MKELTVAASIDNVSAVTEFVDVQLEALDCPMKAQMQIDIAIDEIFSNIAFYAYGDGEGEATIRFEELDFPRAVRITFIDSGVPYNPLSAEEPDITLSAEERKIGGLGIFMVKKSMDAMHYEYKEGKNRLSIQKNL